MNIISVSTRAIYICFFFSGVSALIYEIAWLNKIQLIMGNTVYALSTTLSAYMTGLALGALYVSKIKPTRSSKLTIYLFAELGIGLYAILFYPLLKLIQVPYHILATNFHISLLAMSVFQFIFCSIVLIVPTFLMGTTLPILSGYIYPEENEVSEKIGTLYSVNTLGAVIGCVLAGYLIIPTLGYFRSILLASGINLCIYIFINIYYESNKNIKFKIEEILPSRTQKLASFQLSDVAKKGEITKWSALLLFTSGVTTVLIQTIWNRLAALVYGPSIYIFTLVTTVVLFGIVLGGWFQRYVVKNKISIEKLYASIPVCSAFALIICNSIFVQGPKIVLFWNQEFDPNFWLRSCFEIGFTFCALLPAATLLGMIFPIAISEYSNGVRSEDSNVVLGKGYAFNIFGMVIGALVGSFILLPSLGVEKIALFLELLLCFISAAFLFIHRGLIQTAIVILILPFVLVVSFPKFDWKLLTAGFFYNRIKQGTEDQIREMGWSQPYNYLNSWRSTILDRKDDAYGTISVHKGYPNENRLVFKMDGKTDGSIDFDRPEGGDLNATRLVALYPALVRTNAKSALVVGLGIGSTAAQILGFPQVQSVKVIEISSSMIDFARKYFSPLPFPDRDIWNDSRLTVINQDGRNYLENLNETFDIIVSEPPNPWVAGVASLFTEEYYRAIANHLNPDGIASLWFHSYSLSCESVYSVFAAAAAAFQSLIVFKTNSDFFMIGSNQADKFYLQPLSNDAQNMETTLLSTAGSNAENMNMSKNDRYLSLLDRNFLYDRDEVRKLTQFNVVNQDDNQFLQYQASQTFSKHIFCQNYSGAYKRETIFKYWRPIQ